MCPTSLYRREAKSILFRGCVRSFLGVPHARAQTRKRNGTERTQTRVSVASDLRRVSGAMPCNARSWLVPFESGYRGVNSSCYVTHKTPAYGTPLLYSLHFFALIYSSDLDTREGYSCPDGKRAWTRSLRACLSNLIARFLSLQ